MTLVPQMVVHVSFGSDELLSARVLELYKQNGEAFVTWEKVGHEGSTITDSAVFFKKRIERAEILMSTKEQLLSLEI